MYAIIQTAGKQFRAEPGRTLRLPSMKGEPGAKVVFDQVLLGSDGKTVKAGAPMVKGAKVTAPAGFEPPAEEVTNDDEG